MSKLSTMFGLSLVLATACGPTCPDGGEATRWYADLDGDGHGDVNTSVEACEVPWAHVASADDCDDSNPELRPGRIDRCNGIDDDCDGELDEDGVDEQLFRDLDGDGVGGAVSWTGCGVPPSPVYRATESGDCDDLDRTRRPGASERCNGLDDDCDGDIDEGAVDQVRQYEDDDGDGYGRSTAQVDACPGAVGTSPLAGDCDDTSALVFPTAPERCNGIDDDCDSYVDEVPTDGALFYIDIDGDGWGGTATVAACDEGSTFAYASDIYAYPYDYAVPPDEAFLPFSAYLIPVDVVASSGDCSDFNSAYHPDADEVCDGTDNNCNGLIDDADASLAQNQASRYHLDVDGDGWGRDTVVAFACNPPPNYVTIAGDCDDGDDAVKPYATETCDGIDNDCDGLIDGSDLGPLACP